jgi:hypothetical protein
MASSPGPHPPEHVDIIFSGVFGTIAAPYEIWSFGVAAGFNTSAPVVDLAALALAARAAWINNVSPQVNPQARLTRVRAVLVDDQGHYKAEASGAYALADQSADSPGVGTLSQMPPTQVALAISLASVTPGAVGRGRFYLPGPDLGILTADQITVGRRDAVTTAMKAFLDSINTTVRGQGGSGVVVASRGSVKNGIPGGLRPVVRVGVGRVADTMRSRRNAVPEDRSSVLLS